MSSNFLRRRAAHSIKGASAYMGFEKLAGLTQELESLMSEIQAQSRPVPPKGITLLLECVDYISGAVKRILEDGEELTVPERLLDDLRAVLRQEPAAESEVESLTGTAVADLQIPDDEAGTQELDDLVIGPRDTSISESGVTEFVDEVLPSVTSESKGTAVAPEEIGPEKGFSQEPECIHEDDKELYNIFLASFDEQFLELMKIFSTTGSTLMSDEGFQRAFAAIKRLESSSQHMDYRQVVDILATAATQLAELQLAGNMTGDQCLAPFGKIGSDLQGILPGFRARGLEPTAEALGEMADTVEEEDEELARRPRPRGRHQRGSGCHPPRRARGAARAERDARRHGRAGGERPRGRGPRSGARTSVPRRVPGPADAVRVSEEGPTKGLGILQGEIVRFRDRAMHLPDGERLKVPHMG